MELAWISTSHIIKQITDCIYFKNDSSGLVFIIEDASWNDARGNCSSLGMRLSVIQSYEQLSNVHNWYAYRYPVVPVLIIGLFYIDVNIVNK